jgi:hypothetical protein
MVMHTYLDSSGECERFFPELFLCGSSLIDLVVAF